MPGECVREVLPRAADQVHPSDVLVEVEGPHAHPVHVPEHGLVVLTRRVHPDLGPFGEPVGVLAPPVVGVGVLLHPGRGRFPPPEVVGLVEPVRLLRRVVELVRGDVLVPAARVERAAVHDDERHVPTARTVRERRVGALVRVGFGDVDPEVEGVHAGGLRPAELVDLAIVRILEGRHQLLCLGIGDALVPGDREVLADELLGAVLVRDGDAGLSRDAGARRWSVDRGERARAQTDGARVGGGTEERPDLGSLGDRHLCAALLEPFDEWREAHRRVVRSNRRVEEARERRAVRGIRGRGGQHRPEERHSDHRPASLRGCRGAIPDATRRR